MENKTDWRKALLAGGASHVDLDLFELQVMRFLERRSGLPISANMMANAMIDALASVSVEPKKVER